MTGRQQPAADRSNGSHHIQRQPCTGTGYAGYHIVPVNNRHIINNRNLRNKNLVRILVVYANCCDRFHCANQPLFNGKWRNACGNIAAQSGIGNIRSCDIHLPKGIVHIRSSNAAWADNCQLAGQDLGTAQTVDLSGIRAAKNGKNHLIPNLRISRKIVLMEENTLTGATAIDCCRNWRHFPCFHCRFSPFFYLLSGI